jgi:hypothetical protein
VKLPDGTLLPLLNPSLVPPYITLVVITRHESHPDLFNTIFQLSFARCVAWTGLDWSGLDWTDSALVLCHV